MKSVSVIWNDSFELEALINRRLISLCISERSKEPFTRFRVMGALISRFVIASKHL